MARLTIAERHLLNFPPTETTWLCQIKSGAEKRACGTVNSGRFAKCWVCGGKKPAKPKLLWASYLAVCKKAGHEPGTKWKPFQATPTEPRPARPARRKKP